jgi:hypothetical protein
VKLARLGTIATVAAAALDAEAERLVLGANAARLLGLEVHR